MKANWIDLLNQMTEGKEISNQIYGTKPH